MFNKQKSCERRDIIHFFANGGHMKVICFLISIIYFVKTNQILLFIGKSYYFKKYYLR